MLRLASLLTALPIAAVEMMVGSLTLQEAEDFKSNQTRCIWGKSLFFGNPPKRMEKWLFSFVQPVGNCFSMWISLLYVCNILSLEYSYNRLRIGDEIQKTSVLVVYMPVFSPLKSHNPLAAKRGEENVQNQHVCFFFFLNRVLPQIWNSLSVNFTFDPHVESRGTCAINSTCAHKIGSLIASAREDLVQVVNGCKKRCCERSIKIVSKCKRRAC